MLIKRNDPLGFAGFAWRNFRFIEDAASQPNSPDVHPVTQLVLAMLGLIIFQEERNRNQYDQKIRSTKLNSPDWQYWNLMSPSCSTLEELITNLRHSVAHGYVAFFSSSHDLDKVKIRFRNYLVRKKGKKVVSRKLVWTAHITADRLRAFCLRFKELLETNNPVQKSESST